MWHILVKVCLNAITYKQFVGKQRRLEIKFVGIPEDELLRIDFVNLFSLPGQCRSRFRLIYVLDISNFVSSCDTLNIHCFFFLLVYLKFG